MEARRQIVTLEIIDIHLEDHVPPADWTWYSMLDVAPEHVRVIDSSEAEIVEVLDAS